MPNVTARQLQVFVEAAETLSFARVAERLRLTPSAISFQIKQVEIQADAVLFERMGRKVILTEAGRLLLDYARPVLQSMRDLDEAMVSQKSNGNGLVRLGLVSTAKYIVPHLIARFRKQSPRTTVLLREGNRDHTIALLLAGEVDLTIMGRLPEDSVRAEPFASHPSVIIASPYHDLCDAVSISPTALAQENFVVREYGSGTRSLSDTFFQEAGFTPRIVMETSSNEMIKQAVMANMGLALVSQHTISLEKALGLVKVLAVEGFPIMRSWFVVQRRTSPALPAPLALRQYLIAHGQLTIDELARSHEQMCRKLPASSRDAGG